MTGWSIAALFDEGDEEGAGLFGGGEAEGVEGLGVGVGLGGGGGGEDEDVGWDGWWRLRGPCGRSNAVRPFAKMGSPGLMASAASAVCRAASAPGWMTPTTGMGRACPMSSRARALAVLQAMTEEVGALFARNFALETA